MTYRSFLVFGLLLANVFCLQSHGAEREAITRIILHTSEGSNTTAAVLRGADAKQQLLVTGIKDGGEEIDLTRKVTFESDSPNVASVTKAGVLLPAKNGQAKIKATTAEGLKAELSVTVTNFGKASRINFANQIVPIFTKGGCNGGGCHGKSSGQNGFRLSLLGFEPAEDYEHLVKEARGRRLFPASPRNSLLLLKGTATLPHGGGKRLEPGSDDYKLIVRWISQGMPYGQTNDPVVTRIEVAPKQRTMPLKGEQQLLVLAHYSDGNVQDVTRSALYEANDKELATTTEEGLVRVAEQPGDVAVMVRYQAKVAVFRATVPLGAPVDSLPKARNFIDELVFQKLKRTGMPPSEPVDDNSFLRRVSIDIAGRLPSPEETKAFLADTNAGKRDRRIDALLNDSGYADVFANKWSALLRNKRSEPTHRRGTYAFHQWLRDSFIENKPYDQLVKDILTASGDVELNPAVVWFRQVKDTTAQLEDTAQLFLGQRLQCAQCHHHPYEKWSQQDYYSLSAFFSQVGKKSGGEPGEEIVYHKRGVAMATHKKTKEKLRPAGLGSNPMAIPADNDPRALLANWMTSKENPFFAKAVVNRYWKHFFGRGLVDPEDDMRETNPATNPELLDTLAKDFIEGGYDLKRLVRTICSSQTYQLSSLPNKYNRIDKHNFSRYYPKRLTAEILLDAVNQITKAESSFEGLPRGTRAVQLPDNSFNVSSYFLTVFGRPDSSTSCECERSQDASLAQSLHLLNSKDIQDKLSKDTGRAALLAADTKTPDEQHIRDLYLGAFSREPDKDELKFATEHLQKQLQGKADKDLIAARRQAYEDLLWALLNTKEFLFNH